MNINYCLQKYILEVNPNWKSNSRIFGQAVENWFVENINCFCNGKFLLSNINQKSYDCSCNKCNKKIQIKSQKNIFRPNKLGLLKILGAEYQTTLKSINRKEEWDLFLISYNKNELKVIQILQIKNKFINSECVIPRNPLGPNARRAGWQGCYLEFKWTDIISLKQN